MILLPKENNYYKNVQRPGTIVIHLGSHFKYGRIYILSRIDFIVNLLIINLLSRR